MTPLDSTIQEALDAEPTTALELAQHSLAMRINGVINDLDELVRLAANFETLGLIEREATNIGTIIARAQLVGSMIEVRKPHRLTLVRR